MISDLRSRTLWLDNARAFAILAVVFVHSVEHIYVMNVASLNPMSLQSYLFAITGFTLGRLGVPIFLFLTGYLLLDRNFDESSCYKFWRKNWLGMILTTEAWIVIYHVFLWIFHFQHWDTMRLLKNMFFITNIDFMGHMWYMPMIVGIYICIPFVARSLKNVNIKVLFFPMIFYFIYALGIPVYQVIAKALEIKSFTSIALNLGYSGGVYGLYIILGYCARKGVLLSLRKYQVLGLMIIFFLATVLLQILSYYNNKTYNVWYNCGLLMICSLLLFDFFSRIQIRVKKNWLTWISINSFGIYFLHFPIILLLEKWMKGLPIMMPLKVVFLWSIALIFSFIGCWLIGHFPKVSKILMYNR